MSIDQSLIDAIRRQHQGEGHLAQSCKVQMKYGERAGEWSPCDVADLIEVIDELQQELAEARVTFRSIA